MTTYTLAAEKSLGNFQTLRPASDPESAAPGTVVDGACPQYARRLSSR